MKTIIIGLVSMFLGSSTVLLASSDINENPRPLSDEEISVAQNLGLDVMYVSSPMTKDARRAVDAETKQAMQKLDTYAKRADKSLDRMINFSTWLLERKGYKAEADQIRTQYQERYSRGIYNYYMGIVPADLGDHAPLSEWLVTVYNKLESILGPTVMRITHLEDIKVFNYAIPVVFHPKGYNGDSWDMTEYRNHFVPFGGAVSYWVTWGICVGATWGTGAVFICAPIGEISKYIVIKKVAPPLSDWVYKKATAA